MMPLWTTAMRPLRLTWGWELMSEGAPWVAQRVWPTPMAPSTAAPPWSMSLRTCSRPLALYTESFRSRPEYTATPAES